MRARILRQIPHADVARPVAADNLALVRVYDDVVGGTPMAVAALDRARPRLPDLDRAVLGARHHPFPLAVKRNPGNVARVALKRQQRARVRRFDVVEFDRLVSRRRQEPLVRRDAEPVDLRVGMLDRPRAYPR